MIFTLAFVVVESCYMQVKSVGRDEVLLDIDLGTDPSHPPAIRVRFMIMERLIEQ